MLMIIVTYLIDEYSAFCDYIYICATIMVRILLL